MALRNRTNEFKNMREKFNGNKSESDSVELLENLDKSDYQNNIVISNKGNLSQTKLTQSDYIIELDKKLKENENKIKKKIIELGELQTKRLMVNFTNDEKSQEDEIEHKIKCIHEDIESNRKIISKANNIKNIDDRFKKNLIESHVIKNQNLVTVLRQKQQDYLHLWTIKTPIYK